MWDDSDVVGDPSISVLTANLRSTNSSKCTCLGNTEFIIRMKGSILIPWILITECMLLSLCQKTEECTTLTTINPEVVPVGRNRPLRITCKASSILRLQFDQNPIMYIQQFTPSGPITMATLDGNDTATKLVDGIDVIPVFPTNFVIIIRNPGCSDVTRYGCRVNVTNSTCASSFRTARLPRINGTDGAPRLSISPMKRFYTNAETVVLECSSSFFSMRRLFAWNWLHPLGKRFRKGKTSRRLERSGRTCNLTSSVTLTLKSDDNGAKVFCLTGAANSFRASISLFVADAENNTISPGTVVITEAPQSDCVPSYSLGVLAALVLVFTIAVYTALLLAGGTKLKFPFTNCFGKKDHVYEIPDRGSSIEVENRYYSLKKVQPIYVNAQETQPRLYDEISNEQ